MELLDRYLQAVRFWLPRNQQDDIMAELEANIREQMEDKASELGRPLTEDEQAAILKQHGRPFLVASQYGCARKQLIGPALYPIYRWVVRLALVAAFGIYFVVAAIMALTGNANFRDQLDHCPSLVLTVFACVTLVFAAFEMGAARFHFSDRWDPRALPRLTRRAPTARGSHVSRWQSLCEVVTGLAMGSWWLAALRSPHLLLGPGAAVVTFGPVWRTMWVPILIFMVIEVVTAGVNLLRPDWVRFHSVSRLISRGLGLLMAAILIRAGDLIVAAAPGADPSVVQITNNVFLITLIVGALVFAGQIVWELRTMMRRPRPNPAQAASQSL
jgi:hypothetical protein